MIEITDNAKIEIKEILDNNPGQYLRMVVEGNGYAGPYLRVLLDEKNSDEITTNVNGIEILISDDVRRFAEGSKINIFVNPTGKDGS